jgi:superfamily II DNA or RNA helicase/transcriptional regulator with XRE-family HTH domain
MVTTPGAEAYSERIRNIRAKLGLTQVKLAELLGVSFVSVNRWENGQARPNRLAWRQLLRVEREGLDAFGGKDSPGSSSGYSIARDATAFGPGPSLFEEQLLLQQVDDTRPDPLDSTIVDFGGSPDAVRAVVEGERLSYGHLFSPCFATEVSLIDPVPHQRIAVYEYMLKQPRLRFLLADDAGAGKTIMTGLYIREMLSRRLIRRVLIVPPAGLVGNWHREMHRLFSLDFTIVKGADCRDANPFVGPQSDLVIVSVDTLSAPRAFQRIGEEAAGAYDLVVFDEVHKLACDRTPDFAVRKTDRYRLAEAIAGAPVDTGWDLQWHAYHLLLLTATPHMGKDYPYFCLWRLLEPEALSTPEAFAAYPGDARRNHFIRRTKEEMVRYDGSPIYPRRESSTLGYELTLAEQQLYEETTQYVRTYYNRAGILNASAARLAKSIFQRRLASSTYALLRSLERQKEALDERIEGLISGRIKESDLASARHVAALTYALDARTADEEEPADGLEQSEVEEAEAIRASLTARLADLLVERDEVSSLVAMAREVMNAADESKFQRLREVLADQRFAGEKMLVFTEHRDSMDYLVQRLEAMGHTGKVARIHGGMPYEEREEQVEFFRKAVADGGASYLVATDAAGEGINLQFCWLMVNYDIPWNPARLEQRMGRIHRYGQAHDPVLIFNLVASKTREGVVLKTLLDKMELIRKELGSDKVFDVIGRQFEGVSLRDLILQAVLDGDVEGATRRIEGLLTTEQIRAKIEWDKRALGSGGDVIGGLPAERARAEREGFRRLIPGYVRHFLEQSAPFMGLTFEGDLDGVFRVRAAREGALDVLWSALGDEDDRWAQVLPETRFTLYKMDGFPEILFLHPGQPIFDRYRSLVVVRLWREAQRGSVYVDPCADKPYLFHVALVAVRRKADAAWPEAFGRDGLLEVRLVGLRQEESGGISECPVEHLMFLRGFTGAIPRETPLVASASEFCRQAREYAVESVAGSLVRKHAERLTATMDERAGLLERGFRYKDAELATARTRLRERASAGDIQAEIQLAKVLESQKGLSQRRENVIAILRKEPDLIEVDTVAFVTRCLVVPSTEPQDKLRHDREMESIAVRVAWGHEERSGFTVTDVSTPEKSRAAGLGESPGFDLLSRHPLREERAIEVKGRAGIGDIELTQNEWVKACNLRARYWLYVVYDCASAHPRLLKVRDPFGTLFATAKGGVIVGEQEVFRCAEPDSTAEVVRQ